MKAIVVLLLLGIGVMAEQGNPLGKVLELMASLESKIVKEGEAEATAYKEFFRWCDTQSGNLGNEIKTAERNKEKSSAKISQLVSNVEVSTTKIEELAATISTNEAELKDAAAIRRQETIDFDASEKQLVSAVDTLDRALAVLSQKAAKGAASLAQIDTTSMGKMIQSMAAVVDAAGFDAIDQSKLVAMLQGQGGDEELGAPAAAAYKSQSGGITDVIEDMKEKAEASLADARRAEAKKRNSYDLMRQSLSDQVSEDSKDLDEQKTAKANAEEEKATAQGDLSVTVAELKENKKGLETARRDCMTTAADHQATIGARTEELNVIAKAKKILQSSTEGAQKQSGYSLLQVAVSSTMRTRADLANSEVLARLKTLAKDQHSIALNQLASRISVVLRYGSEIGENPFAKIRSLIADMITKLEKSAASEATEKAYCDEQMKKTETKKADLEDTTDKLVSKIDKAASRSAALKEEVAELQSELAKLSKSQAEMDQMRQSEHAEYKVAKAELEEGLGGVRQALQVLREYYGGAAAASMLQESDGEDDEGDDAKFASFMSQPAAPATHEKSGGAGGSIISILEICESDFATNLAKEETQESDSAEEYEKTTEENKVSQAAKETDVKFKTRESAGLDKQISEVSSDRENVASEAAAVNAYYGKIKERCVAKPESYAERKARRDAEISGLKDALSTLNEQTAFLQRRSHGLRGRFMGY